MIVGLNEQGFAKGHLKGGGLWLTHRVSVKAREGIDGACKDKNKFDEASRNLVIQIMDVRCVTWKDQFPNNVEKLRSVICSEFEYVGMNLSNKGFKNVVKKQMKTKR